MLEGSSGFVYYVSITGITGTRSASAADFSDNIRASATVTDLPIAIGFGVRTPAQAAEATRVADAAVVGSALIETLALSLDEDGRARPGTAAWCWIRCARWPPPCAAFASRREEKRTNISF